MQEAENPRFQPRKKAALRPLNNQEAAAVLSLLRPGRALSAISTQDELAVFGEDVAEAGGHFVLEFL
jgi:hypothetical protein